MSASRPQHILVVDDDRLLAELIAKILAYGGYEVTIAGNAEDALALAAQSPPALLITDVMLPGMDGYSLCRRLRAHPAMRRLPMLVLTSLHEAGDRISSYAAAVDDALNKPFQPPELLARVRRLLMRPQLSDRQQPRRSRAGRILAVLPARGGVGATTIAVNLAVLLRRQQAGAVALCDADLSVGDVAMYLDLSAAWSMADLATAEPLTPELVFAACVPHASGLHVLLSPSRREEIALVTPERLQRLLLALRELYDDVVVDCEPWYDERALAVMRQADESLLVVTPEIGALKSASLLLAEAGKLGLATEQIQLVLNRVGLDAEAERELVERTLQRKVSFSLGNGGRAIPLSTNRGVPLVSEQPEHPFAQQLAHVAASLAASRV